MFFSHPDCRGKWPPFEYGLLRLVAAMPCTIDNTYLTNVIANHEHWMSYLRPCKCYMVSDNSDNSKH